MYCPRCGQRLEKNAHFCGFCGSPVQAQAQYADQKTPDTPYQDVQMDQQPAEGHVSAIRFNSNSILYLIAAFLQLFMFIFWWIRGWNFNGYAYSMYTGYTAMNGVIAAMLITVFMLVSLFALLVSALLKQLTHIFDAHEMFLKKTTIILQLLMLMSVLTHSGAVTSTGGTAGFSVVMIYFCLIADILIECFAYLKTRKQ